MTATFSLGDLIDLARYPLDDTSSPRRAAAVAAAQADLRRVGCAVVPGLIRPDAVTVLDDEIRARKHTTHYSTQVMNPYFHVDPESVRDTTVFLCRDARAGLHAATSTSGWAWKYPGRLGDAPIAGAGFYADSRFGAAACTHTGELAIRAGTARWPVCVRCWFTRVSAPRCCWPATCRC